MSGHATVQRPWTSYSGMNDWQRFKSQARAGHVPTTVTVTDTNWNQHNSRQSGSAPYYPFTDASRRDHYYKRYLQLSQNVAHIYPNVGPARERQGRVGASWRHIKEVQGYDNRVLYVDGIVSLYDRDNLNGRPRIQVLPNPAARQTPLFAASRREVSGCQRAQQIETEKQNFKSWSQTEKQIPPINDSTRGLSGAPTKYKGFYAYKNN